MMRIDRELARRVEHSAAELASLQAAAIAALVPSSLAAAEQLDGGTLVAFGRGRYVNRAVGVGLGGMAAGAIVAATDEFYEHRSMAASLEIGPWVDDALLAALAGAGYRLERFRNVYAIDLAGIPEATTVRVVRVDSATAMVRQAILAGDAPADSEARRISDEYCVAAAAVEGAHDFVAMVGDLAAACGSLNVVGDIGWLGGAATLPAHRCSGLQSELVTHRLLLARQLGCALAAATALPGGQSARNLERLGFSLLHTQAVVSRTISPVQR